MVFLKDPCHLSKTKKNKKTTKNKIYFKKCHPQPKKKRMTNENVMIIVYIMKKFSFYLYVKGKPYSDASSIVLIDMKSLKNCMVSVMLGYFPGREREMPSLYTQVNVVGGENVVGRKEIGV